MLLLSLEVVLSKIAVLTQTVGVMRFSRMDTSCCFLGLAFVVITVVAHVLCVVLLVWMWTNEELFKLKGVKCHWIHSVQQLILLAESLSLEGTN